MRIILAGIAIVVCLVGASIFVLAIKCAFERLVSKMKNKRTHTQV